MKAQSFSPNPYGDQDKGWSLLAVCWAFVTCAFISTVLRVWIRARLTRNLGWDDGIMAVAMVRTIPRSFHQLLGSNLGVVHYTRWRRLHHCGCHQRPWSP